MERMKKINTTNWRWLLCLAIFTMSCNSEFLERDPLDQVTENSFYKTAEDARRAIMGTYSALQSIDWHGKCWMITEIPSDNTTTGGNDPDFSPIDNFTVSADNGPVLEYWREHYKLITLANQVLKHVPNIEMDEEVQKSILGERRDTVT